jgi:putative N6-adenine-specific DNA methylase
MGVSRAGGKLEAALAHFGLAPSLRGARAVDVGASTGGFTETLLAAGAASVLAVDVGHGQLHPSLLADPRVTLLEGTDWRRLPLGQAEGPFDFFTVDVSFVAARNMLRGLAFRLRPGACGVVLIKPQFELPDRQVKGGEVADPHLRREAVEKVRRRAETLGFSLIAEIDSPVAGGSGSIEILAHLAFSGRPDTLPAVGQRRPERPAARRARAAGRPGRPIDTLRWFAIVAPGLEDVAHREIAPLPEVSGVQRELGGVEWTGPPQSGFRANLWLRIATRVLARVGTVEAREFGRLRRRAAGLPWASFIPPGASIALRASASHCRLYHTGALVETAALAIADAVEGAHLAAPDVEADITLLVRGSEDRFTFSADASGERLHRRGARVEAGVAPLRETLAAGLLALADWDPSAALVDPMCGAGTIVIEAGLQALDRAPGIDRRFALEGWPLFSSEALAAETASLRAEARARVRNGPPAPAPILGSDRDARAIESARHNAARAGLDGRIELTCRDVADARPPVDSQSGSAVAAGLVIANPPYGRRLGDPRAAVRAYRDLGRALRAHFRGWRAAVVVPQRLVGAAEALHLSIAAKHPLRNGGLPIALCTGVIG